MTQLNMRHRVSSGNWALQIITLRAVSLTYSQDIHQGLLCLNEKLVMSQKDKCPHGYPKCEFTGKCLCKDMKTWKRYNSGPGRGKSVTFEDGDVARPRERRLIRDNKAS